MFKHKPQDTQRIRQGYDVTLYRSVQMVFAADWYIAVGEILDAHWQPHDPAPHTTGQGALVLASGPSDKHERCTLFFLHVISMARRRLWIASPYFVPDEGILQALQLAAIQGVDVRILRLNFEITLAVTDARFAAEVATMFERDFAQSQEVEPRAYDALPSHQKIGAKAARLLAPIL